MTKSISAAKSATKRTAHISLPSMRKWFAFRPLAVSMSVVFLSACGEEPEIASIYTSVDECSSNNPNYMQECKVAYQEAKDEALRTGPKFLGQADCEFEFGQDNCEYVARTEEPVPGNTNANNQSSSGSFFMPLMAGYMMGNMLGGNSRNRQFSQPMYTSNSRNSALRGRWFGATGKDYGSQRNRSAKVYSSDFKPKPTVNNTVKRGGFGKSVARTQASSRSWGG
jgi:uncharacterized protein YgiB involved in biofilm formation